jgi:hypothetical protein
MARPGLIPGHAALRAQKKARYGSGLNLISTCRAALRAQKKSPLQERAESNLLEENRGDRSHDAVKHHIFLLYISDDRNK